MITLLRDLSIKHKITSIVMVTTIIVLMISSVVFVATEFISFRRTMLEDTSILAEVTATNSAAAILFNDQYAAREILAALKAQPNIQSAFILDPSGEVFASYFKNPLLTDNKAFSQAAQKAISGIRFGEEKYQFQDRKLSYFRPIVFDQDKLGTILLQVDLTDLYSRMSLYAGVGLLVILCTAAIAYLISSKLQRFISGPILSLAETMRIVSDEKKYSVRQERASSDELGILIDGFNDMLSKIEKRDSELERHKENLEDQVVERTRELSIINEELKTAIKELKIAKEVAESANELKSKFLANMSHELRTPLNHVIGFTEIVLSQKLGNLNETQLDYLTDTLGSSKHLLALINDILDLAKIEAGKEHLKLDEIPLKAALDSSLTLVKAKAVRHKIDLSNTTNGIPATIRADERKLKQVLYNLLSNAMKFTPDGGSVSLHATRVDYASITHLTPGRNVLEKCFSQSALDISKFVYPPRNAIQFSVSDTGIGIKAGDQERIFNPFEQADGSDSRQFVGTGLGLSVTKSIVEMHGGAIWLESGGLNKGATFYFVLPILEKAS